MAQDPSNAPESSDGDTDIDQEEYVPSSQLTAGQNAELKAGKLPREVILELLQTIVGIIAVVLALVAIFLGTKALSIANDNAQYIEQMNEKVSVTKQLDEAPGEKSSDDSVSEDTEN